MVYVSLAVQFPLSLPYLQIFKQIHSTAHIPVSKELFLFTLQHTNVFGKEQDAYVRLALCSSLMTEPMCLVTAQFHRLIAPSST